jgi:hypothetical protein
VRGALLVLVDLLLGTACNDPGPRLDGPDSACARTAERFTGFEMGSASTNRVPTVHRYVTACNAAKLTPAEHNCIANAHDTWTAIACVPRMFPDRGPAALGDCKQVIGRTRAAVAGKMQGAGSAGTAMIDKMMTIMETSCVEDGWPESVRSCVLQTQAGDMDALQKCNQTLPPDMLEKLQKRIAAEIPH